MKPKSVDEILDELHDNIIELWEKGEQYNEGYSIKVNKHLTQAKLALRELVEGLKYTKTDYCHKEQLKGYLKAIDDVLEMMK